jgi:hypothetical protein
MQTTIPDTTGRALPIMLYLDTHMKHLSCDPRKFKSALKKFLLLNSFYSLNEFMTGTL